MSRWTSESGPSGDITTDGATDNNLVTSHPFHSAPTLVNTQVPKTLIVTKIPAADATLVLFLDAAKTVTTTWTIPSVPMEIPVHAYYVDGSASDVGIEIHPIYQKRPQ